MSHRNLARDQSPVDADFCLRIATALLDKLSDVDPAEAARFRAGLAQLLDEGREQTDPEPRGAADSASGWRSAARASAPSLRVDPSDRPADASAVLRRSRTRSDSSFARRFPNAARVINLG